MLKKIVSGIDCKKILFQYVVHAIFIFMAYWFSKYIFLEQFYSEKN